MSFGVGVMIIDRFLQVQTAAIKHEIFLYLSYLHVYFVCTIIGSTLH